LAIYRGPGGSGDAVGDASSEVLLALQAKDAAIAAEVAAETAQTAAELAETNAETAATNASNSASTASTQASNAASSASAASTSASNAASSASAASTSASNASTSATNASNSASAASTSATNAANSASAASTSATNAASSATSASGSASTATTQATNAANSASAAATSATNASNSASAASTSATNAASSATSAAGSATTATTQATNASNSASAASTSATNASNSASAASTSATNASNSASAASTSATNASNSASAAATSATNAAASYDSFDDRYLGAKSSAPSVDNDGNTLLVGALYYDTVSSSMKVWSGTAWLDAYANLNNVAITGGSINGTTVGASTASTGKFTTLEATGVTTVQAGTNSAPAITTSGDTNTGIFFPAADTIAFTEGGAEAMRITSAGAVLIGTTSTATSSTLNIDSAGYQPLYVNTTISGGGGAAFSRSGTQALYTGTAGSSWLTGSSTADGLIRSEANMLFATGNTERMRIPTAGGVQSAGSISVGGATPTTSGAGITFPATQSASSDANTLDDYEEGDFSPTVIGSSTAGTVSYSSRYGRYTKIGRVVYVEILISWSSGTGTGNLKFGNLPFTSASAITYPSLSIGYVSNVALTAGNIATAFLGDNEAAIYFYQTPTGGGGSTTVPYDDAGYIQVAGCYTV